MAKKRSSVSKTFLPALFVGFLAAGVGYLAFQQGNIGSVLGLTSLQLPFYPIAPAPPASPPPSPVVSTSPRPLPTPSYSYCRKPGISAFSVRAFCGETSFRYATVICQSGLTRTFGSDTTCKSIESFVQEAKSYCQTSAVCNSPVPSRSTTSPTPTRIAITGYPTRYIYTTPQYSTPLPIPTKSPYPTPIPRYTPSY